MKKIYLTIFCTLGLVFSTNAQVEFDFDEFFLGDVVGQVSEIVLWPAAGVTSSQVTTDQAFSGNQSVVTRPQSGGLVDDILINLGNKESGVWSVEFMTYVPAGATGFWNIQDDENFASTAEAQWNGQFFIGATASGGSAGLVTWDQGTEVAEYPEDQWFSIIHVFDLDNGTHTVSIDGNLMLDAVGYNDTDGFPVDRIGAVNFFAIDANNLYYVDDFRLVEGNLLSTNDFAIENFRVYPNPVQDRLNIESASVVSEITVYNVLGKEVLHSSPNEISPSIDMSSLSSGAYLVKVSINGASNTIKILK
jgi:hypothetical protein